MAAAFGRMTETVLSLGFVTKTEPSAAAASRCSPRETGMALATSSPAPERTPISDWPEPFLCTSTGFRPGLMPQRTGSRRSTR